MVKNKKPIPIISLQAVSMMPFIDYNENESFLNGKGGIVDMFQILCKDLNASKDYDVEFDMLSWAWLYKSYSDDLKIITMNYPVDTYDQISYVDSLIEDTKNPVFRKELETERDLLTVAHEKYDEREFYLMFFSKDMEDYKKNVNRIQSHLRQNKLVKSIRFSKKIQIICKMQNMNTSLATTEEAEKIPRGIPKRYKYNPALIARTQPQGGLSFKDERITKKGDGYEACIHVYDYPANVNFNWLSKVSLFENTIATIDIGTADRLKTITNISKSIDEQISRYTDARYETDKFDAKRIYAQLEQLHDSIVEMGEVVKKIHVRVYAYARTQNELEDRIGKIIADMESSGYKAGVFLDEGMYEWQSMLLSLSDQMKLPNKREGKSIPSETLALGHPYHFASLSDPLGLYYGYTSTNGTVLFDPFQKDKQRLSYCMIILGLMGAGKSTFLKKRIKMDAIMGNYVRGFSTNTEFDNLINHLGGTIINLDGSDGFLNVLQVYRTDENSEVTSFVKHIAKVSTFYKFLVPEADTYDIAILEGFLRKLYKQHMDYDQESSDRITGLNPEKYPIFSDLLNVIHDEMYEPNTRKRLSVLSQRNFERMEQIEIMISNLVSNYGHIFDGHSSIEDFSKEQVVFFNVANLRNFKTVFDAQVYSAMSLLWDNLLAIGGPQKDAFDRGETDISKVRKFTIYMDEAHNFVNARKLYAVSFLESYSRESRKFFGGFCFASQSIRDFMPDNSSADGIEAIKNLFSLAQYKMIFQQPPDTAKVLQTAFGDEIPEHDMQSLPKFSQGECIMSITGVEAVRFKVDITKSDLKLFSGGA